MTPTLIFREDCGEVWRADSLDPSAVAQLMGERKANLLCVDAPYSSRTHRGHRDGKLTADRAAAYAARGAGNRKRERNYNARKAAAGDSGRRDIDYAAWTRADVACFCGLWLPRTRGWAVSLTDDVLAPHWRAAYERDGRVPFAPLPLVETGSRVRMTGDGPACWSCWVVVSRPRGPEFVRWGAIPGAYVQPGERQINSVGGSDRIVGGKPLQSIRAIVRDYSRPGDLVCDPCAGGGTALVAAKLEGRRYLGIECDQERAELSARRCRETRWTPALVSEEPDWKQVELGDGRC